MPEDLPDITTEEELTRFLLGVRATIDEGLTSLGVDPADDVSGFSFSRFSIGMDVSPTLTTKLGSGFTTDVDTTALNIYCPSNGSCPDMPGTTFDRGF